jgi:hypothetical protein
VKLKKSVYIYNNLSLEYKLNWNVHFNLCEMDILCGVYSILSKIILLNLRSWLTSFCDKVYEYAKILFICDLRHFISILTGENWRIYGDTYMI